MKRIPRPVLRALEALAQSPINTSALAMAEGQDFRSRHPLPGPEPTLGLLL
jgi:hypothetical protein